MPLLTALGLTFLAFPAGAQSWAGERSTPALRELVAIDQTGERNWVFGAEDLADDGVANFGADEQAADLRSAYAGVEDGRLWLRTYVSAISPPLGLSVYAF